MSDTHIPKTAVRQEGTREESPVKTTWTLVVVFLSLLIDLLGFTVILPLMPSLLEHYGKQDQV